MDLLLILKSARHKDIQQYNINDCIRNEQSSWLAKNSTFELILNLNNWDGNFKNFKTKFDQGIYCRIG